MTRSIVLALCLFLSGAAALIYEVLWSRQFALVMGQTVYALSTIITAFLGGLAFGSWLGGRWTRRHGASLRLYGAMEIAIGATALCVPVLVRWLDPVFGVLYRTLGESLVVYSLAQLILCAAAVSVPTVLMGATLPVVTAMLVGGRGDVTRGVGMLYAMNTLGGMVGAALSGFVLLPALGMASTALVAVGLNLAVGALAFAFRQARLAEAAIVSPPERVTVRLRDAESATGLDRRGWSPRSLALLYGVSGFAALALEVGWARLVGLSIGSTTYGFTIILVAFIAGIGLGSLLLPRISFLTRDPLRGVFVLHAVIALAGILSVGYLGQLPVNVLRLTSDPDLVAGSLIVRELLLVFATIAVPAMAMGGIFPLLTTLVHRGAAAAGYATGLAYSANTFGNILGSLAAGFVFVPLLGMRATIIAAAMLSGLTGIAYLWPQLRQRSSKALIQAGGLAVAMAAAAPLMPAWQPALLTSAPFLAPPAASGSTTGTPADASRRVGEVISFREGASTVVTVTRMRTGSLMLYQDGVGESNTLGRLHRTLGHIPLLIHGDAKRALVIGLGAGHTLSAVTTHPLEEIDCIEISPEVVDAAREYFVRDGIDDPRVRLSVGDGRNHLRHSGKTYDVIISQPSNVWLAGASSLFTRDFFEEVRDHLNPGGVASSWFYAYTEEARRSIIGAFVETFPRAFLFDNQGVPSLLIGLEEDRALPAASLAAAMAVPRVQEDVRALSLEDPAGVLSSLIAGSQRLREYAAPVPANSDDNGYVAFHGLGDAVAAPFTRLSALQEDPLDYIDPTLGSPQQTQAFIERLNAAVGRQRRR
jgi:spermidine synthase